jgi:MFS family permease
VTETTSERADGDTRLTAPVRNALIALIAGGVAAILDSTMLTLALHTLVVSLHSTDGTMQWVTTGYLLAMAVAIPVTGWAESRWGGRRVWMAALVIFVAGSVLSALSWNAASLIGFRVLQGFGAGLIFPLMQTLAVKAAGGRASSTLIATVSLPLALGPILGPVIGGVILNWLSWRWLFLVNVPVIAVGLVLAWRLLPADRPDPAPAPEAARPRLDVIGLTLLAPALAGILLGLSNLSEDAGDRPCRRTHPADGWGRAAGRVLRLGARTPRTSADRRYPTARAALARGPRPASCTPPARRSTPPCSCCRFITSNCAAKPCCTRACCSFRKASARWPLTLWSAVSSAASESA